jgi:hypothetical protein
MHTFIPSGIRTVLVFDQIDQLCEGRPGGAGAKARRPAPDIFADRHSRLLYQSPQLPLDANYLLTSHKRLLIKLADLAVAETSANIVD